MHRSFTAEPICPLSLDDHAAMHRVGGEGGWVSLFAPHEYQRKLASLTERGFIRPHPLGAIPAGRWIWTATGATAAHHGDRLYGLANYILVD